MSSLKAITDWSSEYLRIPETPGPGEAIIIMWIFDDGNTLTGKDIPVFVARTENTLMAETLADDGTTRYAVHNNVLEEDSGTIELLPHTSRFPAGAGVPFYAKVASEIV